MSVRHFDVLELAAVAVVLEVEPADLALVSEANTRCFRARYHHIPDAARARESAEGDIRLGMATISVSKSTVQDALSTAVLLDYNCDDDRDYRTGPVLLALGRITQRALSIAYGILHLGGQDHIVEQIRQRVWSERNETPRQRPEHTSEQSVYLTGRTRSMADWSDVQIGDAATDDLYMYMLEVLPPAHHSGSMLQMGEPADHKGPRDAPRYATLQRHDGKWIYTGNQCVRVRVTIKK
jgi:hypothetical protein